MRRAVEADGLELVAEFTECEGEDSAGTYLAYVAAVEAAVAHMKSGGGAVVELLIASHAAIGSGEVFREPRVAGMNALLHYHLSAGSVPEPLQIELPAGAPGPLCLYAHRRPDQLDTLVYLCNAGPDGLAEVVILEDCIGSFPELHGDQPNESWAEAPSVHERRWDIVLPGTCVLVGALSHVLWDIVSRYRVTFTDAAGRRWMVEAHDAVFTSFPETPDRVWMALSAGASD